MKLFGLLGHGLSHSLSPQLHRLIYQQAGYDAVYGLFDVPHENVSQVIPAMRALGICGINVTSPHKQAILQSLNGFSPEASKIGAVNTVLLREDGKAWGYNTDYFGFLLCLKRHNIPVAGKSFLICGMSGAGRAIYHALADSGASRLAVASTDPTKGIAYADIPSLGKMDVIINCTPLGMHPHTDACAVPSQVFGQFDAAVDLIYNPHETLFLRAARECGLQTAGGLYMLIFQGMQSFYIWTGIQPDMDAADAVYAELRKAPGLF